ncbi:hypothetical protein [Paenibacillus sonchi]|uniref:hypothetical protein n=1 Tax=Paenibacillus sonchi TaxID=373687 RepID=UPI001F29B7D8|nr:hypothetical protein [Paenibacillus sonchi]
MNKLAGLRCSNNGISAVIPGETSLQRSNNSISAVISGETILQRSNNGISAVISGLAGLRCISSPQQKNHNF